MKTDGFRRPNKPKFKIWRFGLFGGPNNPFQPEKCLCISNLISWKSKIQIDYQIHSVGTPKLVDFQVFSGQFGQLDLQNPSKSAVASGGPSTQLGGGEVEEQSTQPAPSGHGWLRGVGLLMFWGLIL